MISEILMVRIRKGRYKIIFISNFGKAVIIPQKEIAVFLDLLYDYKTDSVIVPNIRNKYRYFSNQDIKDVKIKEM